jgi:hypothetical protein
MKHAVVAHATTAQAPPECSAAGTVVEEADGEATNGNKEEN